MPAAAGGGVLFGSGVITGGGTCMVEITTQPHPLRKWKQLPPLPRDSIRQPGKLLLFEGGLSVWGGQQHIKSPSQIAREGMELQRIESERAKQRMSEGGKQGVLDSAHLGKTESHVVASLGISRDRWYKLLRELRAEGYTQQEIAQAVGVSQKTVSNSVSKITKHQQVNSPISATAENIRN